MDDERIDFSALDPQRNPIRFERMVQTVVAGAQSPTPVPLVHQLARSGSAALAVAALLAVIAWLPNLISGTSKFTTSPMITRSEAVELVSAWAQTGNVPSDADLVQTLGSLYERCRI